MIEALTKMDTYIQLYILLFRQKDFDVGIEIYSHKIREGSIVGTVQCSAPPKSNLTQDFILLNILGI